MLSINFEVSSSLLNTIKQVKVLNLFDIFDIFHVYCKVQIKFLYSLNFLYSLTPGLLKIITHSAQRHPNKSGSSGSCGGNSRVP